MSLSFARTYLNPRFKAVWHGGDYSPEQWPEAIWDQDMRLMEESSFYVATMGMFAWAKLEPVEGRYEFGWLDDVIQRLTDAGRYFILATPSAAPPAWLSKKYPEILRTGPDGVRRLHGNRVNFNLGSPIYREKTRQIAHALAARYGNHPRLLAWHMSNEYCGEDFGAESTAQFREWLKRKFNGNLEALNHAYWTAFWSHTFYDWDEIDPPGPPYGETAIQGLSVDWMRFVTDQTIEFMENEAAPLRELSPEVPITTNLMGTYSGLDYRKVAQHLDFVSWDSYPASSERLRDHDTWITVGFKHDLMRSIKRDKPWLLMEYTPSSANWYNHMHLKRPGVHRFESMHALSHGADGLQYFQWRQSRGGQEQFHGAVVGHAGTNDTRVFAEVRDLGKELETLGHLTASRVQPEVAVVFDWEVRWALDAACGPTRLDKQYERTCIDHYRALRLAGYGVDLVGLDDDFDRYKLVVAPMAYSLRQGFAERITRFVENGGAFVTTYLSGWVDENSLVYEGGFLAPLRKVLGLRSEEVDVLYPGDVNGIEVTGSEWCPPGKYEAADFCELIHCETAEPIGAYTGEFYAGRPALTANRFGKGMAFYVASRNERAFLSRFLSTVARRFGLKAALESELPEGVTVQVRADEEQEYVFLLNGNHQAVTISTADWGEVHLGSMDAQILTRPLQSGKSQTQEVAQARS